MLPERRHLLLIGAILLAGCGAGTVAAPAGGTPEVRDAGEPTTTGGGAATARKPLWGIGVHMLSGQAPMAEVRGLLRELGVNSFRDDLHWSRVERTPGVFRVQGGIAQMEDLLLDDGDGKGYRGLLILDYDNQLHVRGMPTTDAERAAFARYARAMFERFGERVAGFEVWNEWNLGAGSRDGRRASVEDYVLLLREVRRAAREFGLKVPLIAGAVGNRDMPWIRRFVQLGGLALCDGFSVHPYNHSARDASAEDVVAWLDNLDGELRRANGGRSVPLYVSEIGWPTHTAGADEDTAGLRAFKLSMLLKSRSYIEGVWWYDLFDDGPDTSNREHRFGLVRQDRSRKPAFWALAKFIRDYADRDVVRTEIRPDGVLMEFSAEAGVAKVVAWQREGATGAVRLKGVQGSRSRTLSLTGAPVRALADADGSTQTELPLGKWPVIIETTVPERLGLD